MIDVHVYHHLADSREILASIADLKGKLMTTQAELAQQLRDLKDQNDKARAEVLSKIADLEAALANAGSTTAEVDQALADLKASVQIDDDIVPDAPPV